MCRGIPGGAIVPSRCRVDGAINRVIKVSLAPLVESSRNRRKIVGKSLTDRKRSQLFAKFLFDGAIVVSKRATRSCNEFSVAGDASWKIFSVSINGIVSSCVADLEDRQRAQWLPFGDFSSAIIYSMKVKVDEGWIWPGHYELPAVCMLRNEKVIDLARSAECRR